MPNPKTIQRVVKRFQTAYTLEDEQRSGRLHAFFDENRTKLMDHMDPGTSARRAAQELDCKRDETVRTTLKKEGYFPYRISVLHELKREDYSPRYDYCIWFFAKFGHNVEIMPTVFYTDEAWFHLSGYVNSRNYQI